MAPPATAAAAAISTAALPMSKALRTSGFSSGSTARARCSRAVLSSSATQTSAMQKSSAQPPPRGEAQHRSGNHDPGREGPMHLETPVTLQRHPKTPKGVAKRPPPCSLRVCRIAGHRCLHRESRLRKMHVVRSETVVSQRVIPIPKRRPAGSARRPVCPGVRAARTAARSPPPLQNCHGRGPRTRPDARAPIHPRG